MSELDEPVEMVSVPCEIAHICDGDAVIFDWAEFCEAFDCFAAKLQNGKLMVLLRSTYQWVNVSDVQKPVASGSPLQVVK